jgi:hypothetical protein
MGNLQKAGGRSLLRTLSHEPGAQARQGTLQAGFNAAAAAVTVASDTEAGGLSWDGARRFLNHLRHLHTLREVHLHGLGGTLVYGVLDSILFQLAQSLRELPALQVLDLQGIGLWGPAVPELLAALRAARGLTLVDLRGATLGPTASEVIRAEADTLPCHLRME